MAIQVLTEGAASSPAPLQPAVLPACSLPPLAWHPQVEEACGGRAADPSSTMLNLCAVLSELGRHGAALEQAQAAVRLLQAEVREAASLLP